MIEKMYKVCLVSRASEKRAMLDNLKKLNAVHISSTLSEVPVSAESERLKNDLSLLQQEGMRLREYADKKNPPKQELPDEDVFLSERGRIRLLFAQETELKADIARYSVRLSEIAPYGDYDYSLIESVRANGLALRFFSIGKKELVRLDESVDYIRLSDVAGMCFICVTGGADRIDPSAREFVPDEKDAIFLRTEIEEKTKRLKEVKAELLKCARFCHAYDAQCERVAERLKFENADSSCETQEKLCWIGGFVPETRADDFRRSASENGYAYVIDDVTEDDNPPTKIRYGRISKLSKPVFDILGLVPGYCEYDISMFFLVFFSLFFAMIIGDGAYGLIFVLVALALQIKQKKLSDISLLVYVLGFSTVIWGAVTGTWFGSSEILGKIGFLRKLVIPQIANFPSLFNVGEAQAQNALMKFSFIIGMFQLSLACAMNIIRKIKSKDLSLMADVGWLMNILALYFLVLMLVIGEEVALKPIVCVILAGFVFVIVFGNQAPGKKFAKGLTEGLGGIFTTFLDTISAFGNIMSYIRLFAVGMASLAIAESFNNMASPLCKGLALPAGILVLVLGHALNLVMGILSVVVHGVRLNVLEFSGQLGMAWAGIPYEPFGKNN